MTSAVWSPLLGYYHSRFRWSSSFVSFGTWGWPLPQLGALLPILRVLPYHLCRLNLSGYGLIQLSHLRLIILFLKLQFKLLPLGIPLVSMAVDQVIILFLNVLVVGFLLLLLLILFMFPMLLLVAPVGFLAQYLFFVIVEVLVTFICVLDVSQDGWFLRSESSCLVWVGDGHSLLQFVQSFLGWMGSILQLQQIWLKVWLMIGRFWQCSWRICGLIGA